jgi:hypothetical protein
MMRSWLSFFVALAGVSLLSAPAAAEESTPPPPKQYPRLRSLVAAASELDEGPGKILTEKVEELDKQRFEVAGFPIIGGNTDIGVQFGGAATFTRFKDQVKPYLWNLDAVASASMKSDSNGLRLVQQQHVLRLDAPDLWHDRLRIDSRANFLRTINAGYFGVGNNSSAANPSGATEPGRRYQYTHQEGRLRTIGRIHTNSPFDVGIGLNLRYISPEIAGGSKLEDDTSPGGAGVIGARPTFLSSLTAGPMYDTRDSEFITKSGVFYQLGIGGTIGSAEGARYMHTSMVLAHYVPLWGPFIFASRFVTSLQFGDVPYYDQQEGGAFELQNLFGGENGVRGVPDGRYGGKAKALSNTEIRAIGPRFRFLGQRLRAGATTFFDAGRVWKDFKQDPVADGTKLGLKYGVGAGVFLQWGEAAIFRIEAAYSPDATAANPGFPVGIYVGDGLMF